jgi:AbgT putative transporter family
MSDTALADGLPAKNGGLAERALGFVERAGNRVPSPAILVIGLIVLVIALSQVLDWANVGVTSRIAEPPAAQVEQRSDAATSVPSYELDGETVDGDAYKIRRERVEAKGLLTADGIRFMFTSFVPNFLGFAAVGVILVAMIGVGVAEYSGLVGALIRKLVAVSSPGSLTYIIVFVGILSSVASDAGYLVLIPLAAVAFISVGRHPLAGIAAGFGAVSAAFSVNILLTPADGVVTDIANEAAQLVDERLAFGVALAAAAAGDGVLGRPGPERRAGERGPERQRPGGRTAGGDRGIDDRARLTSTAADVEGPADDLARAAVDRGVQKAPAVLGNPHGGHVQMPELVGARDLEGAGPPAAAVGALGLQQGVLAHQPLHPLAIHRLVRPTSGQRGDHSARRRSGCSARRRARADRWRPASASGPSAAGPGADRSPGG